MEAAIWILLIVCTSSTFGGALVPLNLVDVKGLLTRSSCKDAKDCYIRTEFPSLELACFHDDGKCNCMNTVRSDYHLEVVGDLCLMSKYGPCGKNEGKTIEVGCRDNFKCIDGRCRDPNDPLKTVKGVLEFPVKSCKACSFADDLQLECSGEKGDEKCLCKVLEVADKRMPVWGLRNYDGHNNCSAGRHGPCGNKKGIEIGCHGDGIACLKGKCVKLPNKKRVADVGEPCERTRDCRKPLLCNRESKCSYELSDEEK